MEKQNIQIPPLPQVTKGAKGSKTVYTCDGKILRTSKRDYKYVLFGLVHYFNPETRKVDETKLEWHHVGFGNNPQTLINSWKSIFRCQRFEVVTIQ